MNGFELSKGYYEKFGKPMLKRDFPDILPYLAAGFTGSGSEHYGFDDEISKDHDFEPGFCIFLPGEDIIDRKVEFRLERAYAKLPGEFAGVKRTPISPVGGNRCGVMRTAEYYLKAVGDPDGELSNEAWLRIPDYALAEAVNGEIFFDEYGEVTRIRQKIKNMPREIKLKRMAGNLLLMAQSGQYNYPRCLSHGEREAARFAAGEFVNAAMKVIFLLRDSYMPFYKWSFRAMRQLPGTVELCALLSNVILSDVDGEEKYMNMERVCSHIISELQDKKLTKAICGDMEKHAYSVNDMISDSTVRNMNILAGV